MDIFQFNSIPFKVFAVNTAIKRIIWMNAKIKFLALHKMYHRNVFN